MKGVVTLLCGAILLATGVNSGMLLQIPGGLSRISTAGDVFCGHIASNSEVYCAKGSPSSLSFYKRNAFAKQVIVVNTDNNGIMLFALGTDNAVWQTPYGQDAWKKLDDWKFTAISGDSKLLCGISTDSGVIQCRNTPGSRPFYPGNSGWIGFRIGSTKFTSLSVKGSNVFAVKGDSGEIYRLAFTAGDSSSGLVTKLNGGLQEIAFNGASRVCGTWNKVVYCAETGIFSTNAIWHQLLNDAAYDNLEMNGDLMIGTYGGSIYYYRFPALHGTSCGSPSNSNVNSAGWCWRWCVSGTGAYCYTGDRCNYNTDCAAFDNKTCTAKCYAGQTSCVAVC